jgi:hypothetical protein
MSSWWLAARCGAGKDQEGCAEMRAGGASAARDDCKDGGQGQERQGASIKEGEGQDGVSRLRRPLT